MVSRNIKQVMIIIISVTLLFLFATNSVASRLINFQGKLTDQQGNHLNGAYNIIFSIYTSATDTNPIWIEEHINICTSNGIVNVLLGSIQSFDEPVKVTFDQERFLGIIIDCDHDPNTKEPEITPRQRILPAIYAYTADTAHNADNAYNADKLDGKDSSEYTTPEKDAGRPGVVQNLYEGNIRLMDKYIKAEGGTISGALNIIGNVGIGTTNPLSRLYIRNSFAGPTSGIILSNDIVSDALHIYAGGTAKDAGTIAFGDGSGWKFYIGNSVNDQIKFVTFSDKGNVGIGTTSPSSQLHLYSDEGKLSLNVSGNSSHDYPIAFMDGGVDMVKISFPNTGIWSRDMVFSIVDPLDHVLYERMRINSNGNVGIGTTSPNYKLHVVGDIAYTGNIYHPSDIRLKENINPIENAVEKVSSLNGIYFNYKKESAEKREVGVIAQEVEKVIPEVVSSDTDGYRSVDYSKLTPLLIEAIKAQQAQIQAQQVKIEDLQTRIQAIENR